MPALTTFLLAVFALALLISLRSFRQIIRRHD